MPPRYVYWTIIVDGQPTAFRAGSLEDIMPTFNRLKEKQPTAELKWFQNGKLWASRHDAQESIRGRDREGSRGSGPGVRDPRTDAKPAWVPKDKSAFRPDPGPRDSKPEWKPKGSFTPSDDKPRAARKSFGDRDDRPSFAKASGIVTTAADRSERRPSGQARSDRKPEWKPKGTFKPREPGHASGWGEKPSYAKASGGKPGWKPKGSTSSRRPAADRDDKPSWQPSKGSARDQARASFRPKSYTPKVDDGMTRGSRAQSKTDKLEWKPKSASTARPSQDRRPPAADARPGGPNAGFARSDPDAPKRKWVPKAEYKKSLGIEAKRDDKWRPGGEHKDPKQKYKDAKKAKWGRFKEAIRSRSAKPRKGGDDK